MNATKIKLIVSAILLIILAVVVFQNFESITIIILLAKITMPLSVLLLLTFATGMLAGWLLNLLRVNKGGDKKNLGKS